MCVCMHACIHACMQCNVMSCYVMLCSVMLCMYILICMQDLGSAITPVGQRPYGVGGAVGLIQGRG